MTEARRTLVYVGVALALVAGAAATSARFLVGTTVDYRGQPFFPEFSDPNAATSLELVEFDEAAAAARPFKVQNRDGRWTIPSRDDYPADGGKRLADAAATLIALRKEDVASERSIDHERCGVLDPLDETLPTPKGRGTRVTVKGRNDRLLADIILGNRVTGREEYRYVRVPEETRTYIARVDDLNISTTFQDWIERNLLQVDRTEIDLIVIRNYSVDDSSGRVLPRDSSVLRRQAADVWKADGMGAGDQIDSFNANLLVTKLVELSLVDVRLKPPRLAAILQAPEDRTAMPREVVDELRGKGFFLSAEGAVFSTHGEVLVHCTNGIFYVLRFGSLAGQETRYVFISVGLDRQAAGAQPSDAVQKRLEVLRARFAPWYYVVSEDSARKVLLSRADLVKKRG